MKYLRVRQFRHMTALVVVGFLLHIGAAAAVTISGTVFFSGTPISAMVLANGQFTFSSSADGRYTLDVPLDAAGQITLFAFADGFAPFSQTFPASGAPSRIDLQRASPGSPEITITNTMNDYAGPGRSRIGGTLRTFDGTPLNAMALANGQAMFTPNPVGHYDLDVPLNAYGEVELLAFADGFQPAKITFAGNTTAPPTGEAPLTGTWEGGNRATENPYYVCLNVAPDGRRLTTLNTACTGNQGQYRDAFNLQFEGGTEAGGGACGQYAYINEDVPIQGDGTFGWTFSNAWVDIQVSGQFSGNTVSGTTRVVNQAVDCSVSWQAAPAGGNTTPPGGATPPPPAGSGGTFITENLDDDPYSVCLNLSADGSTLTTAGTNCRGNQGGNQYSFDIQYQAGTFPGGGRCNGNANFSDPISVTNGQFTKTFNNGWVNIVVNGNISGDTAFGTASVDSPGGMCSVDWQAQRR